MRNSSENVAEFARIPAVLGLDTTGKPEVSRLQLPGIFMRGRVPQILLNIFDATMATNEYNATNPGRK